MSKAKFDLGNSLAGILGNVSNPDAEEQITYIPLQNLVSDERNFYSMDGVDELAANIELIGLQQPLRVLAGENGFYVIVSGHRRAAAIRLLAEDAPEKWARVPCIVEKPGGSPELEELRLIMANADTRRMSSADLAKQAERVEELFVKLKEQGYEFPGRLRDHVAEACKVSATKLAELKVIRERLAPDWRRLWEENKINHSTAYTIAKEDPDIQRRLAFEYTPAAVESWAQWQVEQAIETVRDPKPKEKKQDPLEDFDAEVYGRQLEEEREHLRSAIKDQWLEYMCEIVARGAIPKNRMDAIDALKRRYQNAGNWSGGSYYDYDGRPNGLEIRPPKSNDKFLARYTDVFDQLALIAIGELYRRFEEDRKKPKKPVPAAAPQQADAGTLQFRSGTPEEKTLAWCAFVIDGHEMTSAAVWWPHMGKWCFEHGASIDAECVGWYPLPDWKGVLQK